MVQKEEILSSIQRCGFRQAENKVFIGSWKGYAVTLQQFTAKTFYVFFAIRLASGQTGLRKALARAIKEPGAHLGGIERLEQNTVAFSFSFPQNADPGQRLRERLDVFANALSANGLPPADRCALSGAANPDSLCLILRHDCYGYQPVCASAVQKQNTVTQAQIEKNKSGGSFALGLIGAIIGMLVGVAANLVTILLLQRIFAIVCALVPIASMFGYKLFNGKMSKSALISVLVLSILSVPLIHVLTITIASAKEYSVF